MGCFSWMYADTDNKKALKIGKDGYVICPDDTVIEEHGYNGYGIFDGKDIYELVVDWNRKCLSTKMLRRPHKKSYGSSESYDRAMKNYNFWCKILKYAKTHDDDECKKLVAKHNESLSREWKRNLGIKISCYDDQNAALPFPIKITRTKKKHYADLPSSNDDDDQGY